ncbi:hypothetical protein VD659_15735 [Herbiconiux sp. 11R-BC]|uniref:hypothetical protein n=1 Tax=Herbiconiux sp. 11R-BC TaxID=3111637 RepID=UPI003C07193F
MTAEEPPRPKKVVNRPGSDPVSDVGPNFSYPFAVAGLVAGVVSLFLNLFLIASVIGWISGGIGVRHALLRRTPEGVKPGFGMSIAALVLSTLGAIGYIVLLVINITTMG